MHYQGSKPETSNGLSIEVTSSMSMSENCTEAGLTQEPHSSICKSTMEWRRTNESCLAHQHTNEVHVCQTRQPRSIQIGRIIMTYGP